ncbi:MAG: Lrp/AsnC ligand binding domain-containing protein [Alsobacter sp.]
MRLRGDVGSAAVRAITTVEARSADTNAVIAAHKRIPDVGQIRSTNGRWDLVIEINAASLEGLDKGLAEIRGQRAITHSETSILLSELK